MSSSVHNGLVKFAPSLYGAADDPACTAILRDGVANGLLHASDAAGMVRVNLAFTPFGPAGDAFDHYSSSFGGGTEDKWFQIGGSPFGPWPLTMRGDGQPYRLRIRLGGAISSADALGCMWRVVIAPSLAEAIAGLTASRSVVFEAASQSTTTAWLTLKGDGNPVLTSVDITPEQAATWQRDVSTFDAVSGASPVAVQQVLVSAYVFAYSFTTGIVPRLYALHVSEVLAP